MTPFFVTGLPRSRSAWIANYLSYGTTFCFHDALKDCQAGVSRLHSIFDVKANVVGNSDPANALVQDKLIERFPGAKWVVVDRPFNEVKASVEALGVDTAPLYRLQLKIEELRLKVKPLIVPYGALDSSIKDIARYVNPEWHHPEARHEMLVHMNVQTDVAWAKSEMAKRGPGISHLYEAPRSSIANDEYMKLVEELCSPDVFAFDWYKQLLNAALMWDHLVDGDAADPLVVNRVMEFLITEWPINPFLKKYGEHLMPAMVAAIDAWKFSYRDGISKDFAYLVYADVPCAIAFVLGGNMRVRQFMPRIRELVLKLRLEDDVKDGDLK